jgi:hypothetical protein
MRSLRFAINLALSVAVLTALCLARTPDGTFERTFQVSGPADLEVLTHSGDITVRAGQAGSMFIRGKIFVGERWFSGSRREDVSELEKNPPIRQTGNSIKIDYPGMHNVAIDYEITVPAETSVRAHSGSGDQTIDGLRSKIDLEAGSGDLRLTSIQGEVRAHTGSGNIDVRDLAGPFTAEAGSGDIRLDARGAGDIRVHTGSGNIQLQDVKGTLRAEAGSGDVSIVGAQTGQWEIRTGSGNVRLRLPDQAAYDLQASTGSGRVVADQPVTMTVQGDVQRGREHSINGKVHGGGPLLMVHTGSGDVHIE